MSNALVIIIFFIIFILGFFQVIADQMSGHFSLHFVKDNRNYFSIVLVNKNCWYFTLC